MTGEAQITSVAEVSAAQSSSSSTAASTTVQDKDKRMGMQTKSLVRHCAVEARHSDPGATPDANQPNNLDKDFDEAMDEDSAELLSDDEMRKRMKAQNMEDGGESDSATETAPALVVAAPVEEEPQAAAMSAEDKYWLRLDKFFERERAFMTQMLDTKLNTMEMKLTTEIKNEAQEWEKLAERVDQ